MASVNKVILLGRVGKEPECKSTFNGNLVASLSLATDVFKKNANGENEKRTNWTRCVFWDKKAEIIQQYVKKGDLLYLEGRLETRDYEDKEGDLRRITEVICTELQLMPRANTEEVSKTTKLQPTEPVKPKAKVEINDWDDDIPF